MAQNIFNAIGIGLMGISMIPLTQEFFPKPVPKYSKLRVAAGLHQPHDDTASLGGSMPGVALFDANGDRISFKSGAGHGSIPDGNYHDIEIAPIHSQNTITPEYMSVSCGASWYHSNLAIQLNGQTYKPSCFWIGGPRQDNGRPTNDFPEGIGLHIIDFDSTEARQTQYSKHPETLCKSKPRLHMYQQLSEMSCLPVFDPPLDYVFNKGDTHFDRLHTQGKAMCEPSANDIDPFPTTAQKTKLQKWSGGLLSSATYGTKKRSTTEPEPEPEPESTFRGRCTHPHDLIESFHPDHTATELCHDWNSAGPDFVSHSEGLLCEMCTRILWPLCGGEVWEGCFDVVLKHIRGRVGAHVGWNSTHGWNSTAPMKGRFPRATVGSGPAPAPVKVYKKTVKWD
ncbi:hypothetical protein BJX99DRAFT_266770 [Aspergillus californicus]